MRAVDITILFVLPLAVAENNSSGLSNGTTYMNAEEVFHLSKSVEGAAATCPANEIKTVKERTSNGTSVEIITSEDSRCTTTVKKFSADTSRNTSSVVTSGNRIITTTSHIRTLITETTSTSVAEMEPTTDTPTIGTMEPSTEELLSTTQNEMPLTTPTTSSTASTRVSPPPLRKKDVHCLFVFDLHNFEQNQAKYEQEKYLVENMSEYFFNSTDNDKSGARLWKYGYTDSYLPAILNAKESKDYFNENLKNTIVEETDDPLSTSDAIATINRMVRNQDVRVNSLIFVSAQEDTSNLPQFKPKDCWKKVIAVGFNDADLSKVVEKVEGEAISISYNFSEHDARNVIDALLKKF